MKTILLTILALFTLGLTTCTRSNDRSSLFSSIPSSSYAVLAVHWPAVANDSDLKQIFKGADIEKLFTELGIRGETVTDFAIFGDLRNSTSGCTGLITQGSFDADNILQAIKNRGWTERDFDGQQVFVNPADGGYLTALDSTSIAFGTPEGVKAILNARADSKKCFTSNPAYHTLSDRFDEDHYPILMMVTFPQAAQDAAHTALQVSSTIMDLAGVGPLGELLNKIGYAQGVGCAISRDHESFPVELMAIMRDEESAKFVAGGLNLLKGFAELAPGNKSSGEAADAGRALQSLSIERTSETLIVKITMARRDLLGASHR